MHFHLVPRVKRVLPRCGDVLRQRLERGEQPNACSAVLRVERKETAVLIGGDAELGTWERLGPELRAAIAVRPPHHGGEIRRGGNTWKEFQDLCDAIDAGTGAISVGTEMNHPRYPLDRYPGRRSPRAIMYTVRQNPRHRGPRCSPS